MDGENGKMIFIFILSTVWSGESSAKLEKLGDVVNYPRLDYH